MQVNFLSLKHEISYHTIVAQHHSLMNKKILRRYDIWVKWVSGVILFSPWLWLCFPKSPWWIALSVCGLFSTLYTILFFEARARSVADYEVIKQFYKSFLPSERLSAHAQRAPKQIKTILNKIQVSILDRYCQRTRFEYVVSINDLKNRIQERTGFKNKFLRCRWLFGGGSIILSCLFSNRIEYFLNNGTWWDSTFARRILSLFVIGVSMCFMALGVYIIRTAGQEKRDRPDLNLRDVLNAKLDQMIDG